MKLKNMTRSQNTNEYFRTWKMAFEYIILFTIFFRATYNFYTFIRLCNNASQLFRLILFFRIECKHLFSIKKTLTLLGMSAGQLHRLLVTSTRELMRVRTSTLQLIEHYGIHWWKPSLRNIYTEARRRVLFYKVE